MLYAVKVLFNSQRERVSESEPVLLVCTHASKSKQMTHPLLYFINMPCFTQLKLNLHFRNTRWSAGPLRCRTKACHSTRGLVGALTWFGSVLEAAVGGAPDDASQGCLLALSLLCLRVCVTIVQTCLTCCLGV
jgi:hypothetical protein